MSQQSRRKNNAFTKALKASRRAKSSLKKGRYTGLTSFEEYKIKKSGPVGLQQFKMMQFSQSPQAAEIEKRWKAQMNGRAG